MNDLSSVVGKSVKTFFFTLFLFFVNFFKFFKNYFI